MTGQVKVPVAERFTASQRARAVAQLVGILQAVYTWPADFCRQVATSVADHQAGSVAACYATTFAALPDSPEPGDLGYPGAGQAVAVEGPRPDFDRPLVINHRQGCTGYCTCSGVPA